MIKKVKIAVLCVFVLLASAGAGFTGEVRSLPEVLKPDNITVHGNKLYVVEGAEISIYSLEDLSLTRKWGTSGEGPGELRVVPGYVNKVRVISGSVVAESFDKLIYFSSEGNLQKEIKKKSFQIVQAVPIGANFVVARTRIDTEKKIMYYCICLYNSKMEETKEIYRELHPQQGLSFPVTLDMTVNFIRFEVVDDKFFIEESGKGFLIEVFDKEGEKLYQIQHPFEKIKLTGDHEKEIIERFKADPLIKLQIQANGGWAALKKLMNMKFPDTYPAIKSFEISNNKIYVQTYKVVEGKSEYVVMDFKGKIIKRVYLAKFENTPILSQILGAKLHTIHDNKLYYLMENEDEEEWELHVEEIK
ncbi:MAG: hypothetical protein GY940_19255 [bacterium]|nr:hypothetical protein [bacterium]